MGLDAIEITRPLEEAFGIRIEDAEIAQVSTPGELIDLVMNKIEHADPATCLTHRAFNLLRGALIRQTLLNRRGITPTARLADLLPKAHRKIVWDILPEELGTGPLPPLVRPAWLVNILIACSIITAIVFSVVLRLQKPSTGQFMLFLAFAAVGVITGFIGDTLTRSFCTQVPPRVGTVGGLAQWIVAHKPDLAECGPGKWTREQVAARVRDVVIENLDCSAQYREDASFVKDLGSEDG